VWCYAAQTYRSFGNAAEYAVVPVEQAVPLPAGVSAEQGACLGIPTSPPTEPRGSHRAVKQAREILDKLLSLLQASEADKFAAHLYHSRRQYRHTCERPNKGNKAIEREVISSYQVAQSLGFKGDYRAWEHLLRIRE
jgi:hypothetical protein